MQDVIEYDSPGWATLIYGRKPTLKAHAHIGLAKLALSIQRDYNEKFRSPYGKDMGLYQLVMSDEGKLVWKLHTEIKAGTTKGDYPEIWKSKTKPGGNNVQDV